MKQIVMAMCSLLCLAMHSSVAMEETPATQENTVVKQGHQLHDEANCLKCHETKVYTREDRKVSNYDGLKSQVQNCVTNLRLQWFEDEVNAVATYLNSAFYRFDEEKPEGEEKTAE